MEKLGDFMKELRDRLASPFFFSFLISWIFFNWPIVITLLWYNEKLYPKEGDLIQFIANNTDTWRSAIYPLVSAIIYTGVLKNAISAFIAFSGKWGGNLNLWISQGTKVPIAKFLAYRDLYMKANKSLETVLADESKTIEEFDKQRQKNSELETENNSLKLEVSQQKAKLDELDTTVIKIETDASKFKNLYETLEHDSNRSRKFSESYKDLSFLYGTWTFYMHTGDDKPYEEVYYIIDKRIQIAKGAGTSTAYVIDYFFHDIFNGEIILFLQNLRASSDTEDMELSKYQGDVITFVSAGTNKPNRRFSSKPVIVHQLKVEGNNTLTGVENFETRVSYLRST